MKAILEELRACVYNYYDELIGAADAEARDKVIENHSKDALPKFSVTIKAKAN